MVRFIPEKVIGILYRKFPFCYYFANPMYETCKRDSDHGPEPLCDNSVDNF